MSQERGNPRAVARKTEVIGSSNISWDDAIQSALERANKSLRGLIGIEVVKQNARIEKGRIAEYRVHIIITFMLEDAKE
ncbi:dodecin family protein [Candidatus Mycalebacterium sp.]